MHEHKSLRKRSTPQPLVQLFLPSCLACDNMPAVLSKAVTYLRASSRANAADDGHSYQRQLDTVMSFAGRRTYAISKKGIFWDVGVSGRTPVEERDAFQRMLAFMIRWKIWVVLFEDASRLARCVVIQEMAMSLFKDYNILPISCASPESFVDDTPHAVMIRQMVAVFNTSSIRQMVAVCDALGPYGKHTHTFKDDANTNMNTYTHMHAHIDAHATMYMNAQTPSHHDRCTILSHRHAGEQLSIPFLAASWLFTPHVAALDLISY